MSSTIIKKNPESHCGSGFFFFLFLLVVLSDVAAQLVILVAFRTSAYGILHLAVYAVDVVQQVLLGSLGCRAALLDDADDIGYLLAAHRNGITEGMPLSLLLLL